MQHTSVSPDSKILAVVGDDLEALLVDSQNGKVHSVYSFISNYFKIKYI